LLGERLRAAVAVALALVIFVVTWLYRFNDPGGSLAFLTDDHFFYVVRGWQILFGDLPVRDFVDHGAPLYYYVAAAVQWLGGRGTLSELVFSVTVLALCASGIFLIAARASGSLALGVLAAWFHVLLDTRFYNYPKILVYVAAIPALWWWANRPTLARVAVLAVITVIGFLLRHDHGVFVALAFAVMVVLVQGVPWRVRLRHTAAYALLGLLLVAPYLAFISVNGGIGLYFRTALAWAERDRARAEVVWPGLFDYPDGTSAAAAAGHPIAIIQDNAVAWAYYGELALPVAALIVLTLSPTAFRPSWPNAVAKIGTVAVLGIVLNAGFLRGPLEARLADPSVPHAVLLAWLVAALYGLMVHRERLRPSLQRPAAAAVARGAGLLVAVPVIAVMLVTVGKNGYDRFDKANLVDGPRNALERMDRIWTAVGTSFDDAVENATDVESTLVLARYVRECTLPTDRVFMQHYLPQVAALGDRGFAGGHADLRPGFFRTEEMQRLTVERLSHQSVPVVFVGSGPAWGGFREDFPMVARYFDAHYRAVEERRFGSGDSVQLLVRNDRHPVRTFELLGWPCFR
jgi:hypothetical protein